jgi:glutaredoxin
MKTLIEINNEGSETPSYSLADSRLNQTIPLRNFHAVKKMPNEYFNTKFKSPSPTKGQQYTQKNKILVLYGRDSCPFCKSSIRLINSILDKKDEFIYINIELVSKYDKNTVTSNLKDIIGNHKTVPIIFCNDEFIGGNSELNKYLQKK